MKIGVAGCKGRMGQMLCRAVVDAGHVLIGGTERAGSACIGEKAGDGVVTDDARDLFAVADAVLDFTSPENSVNNARIAAERGKVVSVEPGLYYSDWGGIRLEDLVAVTRDGCRCLNTMEMELEIP